MDWELHSGGNVRILCCDRTQAVCIAARNLVKDIEKVFSGNIHVDLENCTDDEYSIKIIQIAALIQKIITTMKI